jgi:hypothetical protein
MDGGGFVDWARRRRQLESMAGLVRLSTVAAIMEARWRRGKAAACEPITTAGLKTRRGGYGFVAEYWWGREL